MSALSCQSPYCSLYVVVVLEFYGPSTLRFMLNYCSINGLLHTLFFGGVFVRFKKLYEES